MSLENSNQHFESHPGIAEAYGKLNEKIKKEGKGDQDLKFVDEGGRVVFVVSKLDDGDYVIEEGERAFHLSNQGYLPETLPNFDATNLTSEELQKFSAEYDISSSEEVVEIVEKMLKLKVEE